MAWYNRKKRHHNKGKIKIPIWFAVKRVKAGEVTRIDLEKCGCKTCTKVLRLIKEEEEKEKLTQGGKR